MKANPAPRNRRGFHLYGWLKAKPFTKKEGHIMGQSKISSIIAKVGRGKFNAISYNIVLIESKSLKKVGQFF